jgi:hypothetical protein
MTFLNSIEIIPDEIILNQIYFIRGQKVMFDKDLAKLYGVETKRLNEQVRRNSSRFPAHFMFQLTDYENEALRSQIATLKPGEHSKYNPFVFTEHGVLMLSNVLKSESAIAVSIRIIDVFVKLRQAIFDNSDLRLMYEELKKKTDNNTKNIELVFQYLDELLEKKENPEPRKVIGFKLY